MKICSTRTFAKIILSFLALFLLVFPAEAAKKKRAPEKEKSEQVSDVNPAGKFDKEFRAQLLTVFHYKNIANVPRPSLWAVEKTVRGKVPKNDDERNVIKLYKDMMKFYAKECKNRKRKGIFQYPESQKIFQQLRNAVRNNFPSDWAPDNLK